MPPITLEVGGLEEVVTVEASALHAQAQSGERSGTIRADEIKDTQLRGRDFLGLLQGMPGVVDTNVRNAPGWNAFLGTQINGLSDQLMGMSYDGVSSKDTGFGAANYVTPSLDSIAEVKIQTSNYQAEYGRAGGANIIVVTKSGSSQFSGSAAYFKRHEALTENSWDRRRTCDATGGTSPLCAKPRYRYDNSAFTLGGPVLIPGTTFNEKRDKLFFFYSLDLLPRTDPFLVSSTMPSALERNGDFSQTRNNAGVAALHPQPVQRAAVQRQHRRRRLLPGERHSAEHDPSDGPADHEPVPAAGSGAGGQSRHAGQLQLSVRRRYREAAPRQRRSRRLEHPAGHDVLYPRSRWARKSSAAASTTKPHRP